MSENVERALEIVRNFTEAEFHSFMEMSYISETSQSSVSFNDLFGKNRFKNDIVCPHCNSHSAVRNGKRNVKERQCNEFSVTIKQAMRLKKTKDLP